MPIPVSRTTKPKLASALKTVFTDADQAVALVLKDVGFVAAEIASALKTVFTDHDLLGVLEHAFELIIFFSGIPVVLGLVARPHVRRAAAAAIDRSPNHGLPAPAPRPGELRVEIASPPASLAMELVDVAPGTTLKGTVFVLHGIRDHKESMRSFGAMLAESGFRAILVDLRGHGRSSGEWLSYGAVESHDLAQVLDALTAQGLVIGKVGVDHIHIVSTPTKSRTLTILRADTGDNEIDRRMKGFRRVLVGYGRERLLKVE